MSVCGGPPATGRKAVPARVGMAGPLGSGDPQGAVPFSADLPPTSSPSDRPAPCPESKVNSPDLQESRRMRRGYDSWVLPAR